MCDTYTTEYVITRVDGNIDEKQENKYKTIEVNHGKLLFIPYNEYRNSNGSYKNRGVIITMSWSIMLPVLNNLLEEDWELKFENDEDRNELNEIDEDSYDPRERLEKVEGYFKTKYKWPNGIPDPILHTRLIITPTNGRTHIIFYYGETVSLGNNTEEDITHLFKLIMDEYDKWDNGTKIRERKPKKYSNVAFN
jgi:hypothetical protein